MMSKFGSVVQEDQRMVNFLKA